MQSTNTAAVLPGRSAALPLFRLIFLLHHNFRGDVRGEAGEAGLCFYAYAVVSRGAARGRVFLQFTFSRYIINYAFYKGERNSFRAQWNEHLPRMYAWLHLL